ncbi:TPA: hypothetical protein QEL15_004154 [Stenotrophomonas maltophilia]|nr:hypothetical protein [Stenotrophomonas maltophilia]
MTDLIPVDHDETALPRPAQPQTADVVDHAMFSRHQELNAPQFPQR